MMLVDVQVYMLEETLHYGADRTEHRKKPPGCIEIT